MTFFGGFWGIIGNLVLSAFGIDLGQILSNIISGLLGLGISKDNKTTSEVVEGVVSNALGSMLKLSSDGDNNFNKNANILSKVVPKSTIFSFLKSFLTAFFKYLLLGSGFMLAKGVAQKGLEQAGLKQHSFKPATQTKFKVKPSYVDSKNKFMYAIPNTTQSIQDLIISFVNNVYDGLEGKESLIKSTTGFNLVVDIIEEYNMSSKGTSVIVLPPELRSQKTTVDIFIDEVAAKSN
jgi:hypothetical protein